MRIIISNSSSDPIYEQITHQIKNAIISGDLEEGELLPSIRSMAKDLQVSVITVKRSYEDLEKEGFINTMAGKGSFVAPQNPEFLKEKKIKQIEDILSQAVKESRLYSIKQEVLHDLINILYGEEE